MVEVFKTNVINKNQSEMVVDHIHQYLKDYQINFDLEDCDKILRVKCSTGKINADYLISLLNDLGVVAEVLPDDGISQL